MTGRVIHKPTPGHSCAPGWTYGPVSDGGDEDDAVPQGYRPAYPPRGWDYPKGTVWACDQCGQTWVSTGPPEPNMPGFCDFRRESRRERRRREKRQGDTA